MLKPVLIIIPAYNEEQTIVPLLDQLRASGTTEYADVLVVNDASTDDTWNIVRAQGVLCVSNIFNLGYGSALQLGYKYAARHHYDYVIQMDADGQHDVCNVRRLYDALRPESGQAPDIVIGSRFLPESESFPISGVKHFAIRLFSRLIRLFTGEKILDPTSGLQGLSRGAFTCYARYNNFNSRYPDANMIIQMLMKGYIVREIPAVMHARDTGTSMHSGLKPVFYMLLMMMSVVTVALRERALQRRQRAKGVTA